MTERPYHVAGVLALPEGADVVTSLRPERAARVVAELQRRSRLRAVYEATQPHADLCEFDAQGMDIIEGRRV
jgi:hypothetical protein